jgi:hypothetical protein
MSNPDARFPGIEIVGNCVYEPTPLAEEAAKRMTRATVSRGTVSNLKDFMRARFIFHPTAVYIPFFVRLSKNTVVLYFIGHCENAQQEDIYQTRAPPVYPRND